jgi:hypothetical protein
MTQNQLNNSFKLFALCVFCTLYNNLLQSQPSIYCNVQDASGQYFMYKLNATTCSFCPVASPSPNIGNTDMVFLPDGSQLHIDNNVTNGLTRLSTPPNINVLWQGPNGYQYNTGQYWVNNGLVYLGGVTGLGTYNPATNALNYIGNWPSSFSNVVDLFWYVGGQLYGNAYDVNNNPVLVLINTTDPSLSTIVGPSVSALGADGFIWTVGNLLLNGYFYIDQNSNALNFYAPQTNESVLVCDIPAGFTVYGISIPLAGVPEYSCGGSCNTDAGTIPQAGPFSVCTNGTLNFPASFQPILDPDDLLRYVLFTNPNDTAGSIVATSNTPSFTFAAPMQTNLTYYIAAMAGNSQNGTVDLNDPCLDFSNALKVVWKPTPTVTFSTTNSNDVCPGGCKTIHADFTGSPPFTLSYNSPAGSNTQVFSGNSGSFTVCPPSSSVGNFVIQATGVMDAFCACP